MERVERVEGQCRVRVEHSEGQEETKAEEKSVFGA